MSTVQFMYEGKQGSYDIAADHVTYQNVGASLDCFHSLFQRVVRLAVDNASKPVREVTTSA